MASSLAFTKIDTTIEREKNNEKQDYPTSGSCLHRLEMLISRWNQANSWCSTDVWYPRRGDPTSWAAHPTGSPPAGSLARRCRTCWSPSRSCPSPGRHRPRDPRASCSAAGSSSSCAGMRKYAKKWSCSSIQLQWKPSSCHLLQQKNESCQPNVLNGLNITEVCRV